MRSLPCTPLETGYASELVNPPMATILAHTGEIGKRTLGVLLLFLEMHGAGGVWSEPGIDLPG